MVNELYKFFPNFSFTDSFIHQSFYTKIQSHEYTVALELEIFLVVNYTLIR